MSAIRRLVERQRQMWLMRKRAKPFASLAGYAPNSINAAQRITFLPMFL